MNRFMIVVLLLCLGGCDISVDDSADIAWLQAPGTEDLGLPFSSAVRVDDLLFLSGALGIVPGTMTLAEGGIQGETRQTLENIKCTVFLADMGEWGAMNEVYRTFFVNPPARSALGASGLALDARVEIECIAVME